MSNAIVVLHGAGALLLAVLIIHGGLGLLDVVSRVVGVNVLGTVFISFLLLTVVLSPNTAMSSVKTCHLTVSTTCTCILEVQNCTCMHTYMYTCTCTTLYTMYNDVHHHYHQPHTHMCTYTYIHVRCTLQSSLLFTKKYIQCTHVHVHDCIIKRTVRAYTCIYMYNGHVPQLLTLQILRHYPELHNYIVQVQDVYNYKHECINSVFSRG